MQCTNSVSDFHLGYKAIWFCDTLWSLALTIQQLKSSTQREQSSYLTIHLFSHWVVVSIHRRDTALLYQPVNMKKDHWADKQQYLHASSFFIPIYFQAWKSCLCTKLFHYQALTRNTANYTLGFFSTEISLLGRNNVRKNKKPSNTLQNSRTHVNHLKKAGVLQTFNFILL